jgi:hypothetical protein
MLRKFRHHFLSSVRLGEKLSLFFNNTEQIFLCVIERVFADIIIIRGLWLPRNLDVNFLLLVDPVKR